MCVTGRFKDCFFEAKTVLNRSGDKLLLYDKQFWLNSDLDQENKIYWVISFIFAICLSEIVHKTILFFSLLEMTFRSDSVMDFCSESLLAHAPIFYCIALLREAAKKIYFLSGPATKASPPPRLSGHIELFSLH